MRTELVLYRRKQNANISPDVLHTTRILEKQRTKKRFILCCWNVCLSASTKTRKRINQSLIYCGVIVHSFEMLPINRNTVYTGRVMNVHVYDRVIGVKPTYKINIKLIVCFVIFRSIVEIGWLINRPIIIWISERIQPPPVPVLRCTPRYW